MPLYSSKFSKRVFTQPQLVTLYCLKLKLGVTYRELMDWLAEMPRIQQALGLRRFPYFTTVQKAFQRLGAAVWCMLQRMSASLLTGDGIAAAANARMDQEIYHRRSLIETVISVLKRKYGTAVSSRVWSERLGAAFSEEVVAPKRSGGGSFGRWSLCARFTTWNGR